MTLGLRWERPIRVLVVLGDRTLAKTVDLTLRHGGYVRRTEGTVNDAQAAIVDSKPHLMLLDIDLEAGTAIHLIDDARAAGPIGVIALTRRSDLRGTLEAFERGPTTTSPARAWWRHRAARSPRTRRVAGGRVPCRGGRDPRGLHRGPGLDRPVIRDDRSVIARASCREAVRRGP